MYSHRLEANLVNNPEWVEEFLSYVDQNPNCCHEVWMCSAYGFPPLEKHRAYARGMKAPIAEFKKRGIDVALQISNTIGGHNNVLNRDCTGLIRDDWHAPYCVTDEGKEWVGRFCSRSKEFSEYVQGVIGVYLSELDVCGVWIDDDFKMGNRNFACWCDDCIAEFSKRCGRSFTREELVRAVNDELDIRDKWIEFTSDRIYDAARMISDTVHKFKPDAYVALEHGANGYMQGLGHKSIFKGFMEGSGIAPKSRPGAGAYEDYDPNTFIEKYRMISHQTRYLPEFVEDIRPEIECIPDVAYGKTLPGLALETAFYFAAGATSVNFASMMRRNEPLSWLALQLRDMSENYEWLLRLSKINRETTPDGVEVFIPEKPWNYKTDVDFDWEKVLFDEGIEPIRSGYGVNLHKTGGVLFVHHKYAEAMTDGEIENLLSRNVVCDGETAALLTERGYGDALGVTAVNAHTGKYYELLPNGFPWQFNFFFPYGSLLTLSDRAREVTAYHHIETDEKCGVSSAYTETTKGGRWAVIGYGLFRQINSFAKRCAVVDAIEWAGGQLSAKLTTPDRVIVLPRKDKITGRLRCVSFLSTTVGKTYNMELQLAGRYDKCEYRELHHPISIKLETRFKNGSTFVTIPEIDGWNVGTLFLD